MNRRRRRRRIASPVPALLLLLQQQLCRQPASGNKCSGVVLTMSGPSATRRVRRPVYMSGSPLSWLMPCAPFCARHSFAFSPPRRRLCVPLQQRIARPHVRERLSCMDMLLGRGPGVRGAVLHRGLGWPHRRP